MNLIIKNISNKLIYWKLNKNLDFQNFEKLDFEKNGKKKTS